MATKYTAVQKEQAIAHYLMSGCFATAARECDVPESTVRSWVKKAEAEGGEIKKLREKKRAEFAEEGWDIIATGILVLKREMYSALQRAERIDELIDEILALSDDEMKYKEKMKLVRELSRTARPDIREITTAIGTLYDKAALARGEATSNEIFNVKICDVGEPSQSPAVTALPEGEPGHGD